MHHELGEEEVQTEDEYVAVETHDDSECKHDNDDEAQGSGPTGSGTDNAETYPQHQDDAEFLASEDEMKGAHKVGKHQTCVRFSRYKFNSS